MGKECGLNSVRGICSMAIFGSGINEVSWACSGEGGGSTGRLDHRCVVVLTLRSSAECTSGSYVLLWAAGAAGQQGQQNSRLCGAVRRGKHGGKCKFAVRGPLIIIKLSYQPSGEAA